MTCIVGYVYNGIVYMGSDSQVTENGRIDYIEQKVFFNVHNNEFLIGFCGDLRYSELLRYYFVPPQNEFDWDIDRYICTDFCSGMRKCLVDNGYSNPNNKVDGGCSLIGYKGRLYQISCDHGAFHSSRKYNSIGSGCEFALGAMSILDTLPISSYEKVSRSLESAIEGNFGCGGNITILQSC